MKLYKTLKKHYLTLIGKGYALDQTQIVMRYSISLLITESASQTNCRRTTYLEIFLPLPITPLVRYQFQFFPPTSMALEYPFSLRLACIQYLSHSFKKRSLLAVIPSLLSVMELKLLVSLSMTFHHHQSSFALACDLTTRLLVNYRCFSYFRYVLLLRPCWQ